MLQDHTFSSAKHKCVVEFWDLNASGCKRYKLDVEKIDLICSCLSLAFPHCLILIITPSFAAQNTYGVQMIQQAVGSAVDAPLYLKPQRL